MKKNFPRLSELSTKILNRAHLSEHTFMIFLALIVGGFSGLAAIGIRFLINEFSALSFPGNKSLLQNIIDSPWYLKLLIPALGGLIVGPLIHFFAPEAKGHGVSEVMESILLKGAKIRPRVAVIKAFASAVSIGTGGSVGREGPIIQIGSSIGSTVGQFFKVHTSRLKTLVGCGAAAGIAAAFNAPIAGALFAVEIILMDFAVTQFSPIVISSVMATIISQSYEGKFVEFSVPTYHYVSPNEFFFYVILGILCGLVSYLFIKILYSSEEFFDKKINFPVYLKPALGGLCVGLIALTFPEIMGMGDDTINSALHGNMFWSLALALIFLKILATSLSLGSGGSGGVFAPSLFIGAVTGAFFGYFVHQYFPDITPSPAAYALVAMGGLVAGTTRAPITAIIIVFELTNDYNIILPLIITCIISMILSTKLSRESIYTLKLLLKNIKIREGADINVMSSIFVKDIYRNQYDFINHDDNFGKVANITITKQGTIFPVLNKEQELTGVVMLGTITNYLFEKDSLAKVLIASDVLTHDFEIVTPDDNCQTALDKLRRNDVESLPVVDSANARKILGMVWMKDIQEAYQKEIERREIASTLASSISMKDEETHIHFMEGYSITELTPPKSFIGKSIKELNIRAKYGVDVLSIKTKTKGSEKVRAIPNPDYIITENDILVTAGEIKNINLLKTLQ